MFPLAVSDLSRGLCFRCFNHTVAILAASQTHCASFRKTDHLNHLPYRRQTASYCCAWLACLKLEDLQYQPIKQPVIMVILHMSCLATGQQDSLSIWPDARCFCQLEVGKRHHAEQLLAANSQQAGIPRCCVSGLSRGGGQHPASCGALDADDLGLHILALLGWVLLQHAAMVSAPDPPEQDSRRLLCGCPILLPYSGEPPFLTLCQDLANSAVTMKCQPYKCAFFLHAASSCVSDLTYHGSRFPKSMTAGRFQHVCCSQTTGEHVSLSAALLRYRCAAWTPAMLSQSAIFNTCLCHLTLRSSQEKS